MAPGEDCERRAGLHPRAGLERAGVLALEHGDLAAQPLGAQGLTAPKFEP